MDALTARVASTGVNRDARSSDFAVFLSTPLMGAIEGAWGMAVRPGRLSLDEVKPSGRLR
jgi:hypothetical protein